MSKIQNLRVKFIVLFLIFSFIFFNVSHSQSLKKELQTADSLFKQKKYVESFEIYNQIYESGFYSPSMLLRMAYIKEGLGDFTNSLFFLNLYQLQTSDKQTLGKMESLAEKHKLQGYTPTDFDFFAAWYKKFYHQLVMGLAVLLVLMVSIVIYRKRKGGSRSYVAFAFLVIFSCILYWVLNSATIETKGIIMQNNSYLMSAPSAGANVVEVVQKGHRVRLLGKNDVWLEIQWDNKPVFIKEDQLRKIY